MPRIPAGSVRSVMRQKHQFVTRHPWSRLLAMLVDWFCILVWVAITAAVGVPLYLSGVTHSLGAVALNLVAALLLIVPTTAVLTVLESSPREASVGNALAWLVVPGRFGFR